MQLGRDMETIRETATGFSGREQVGSGNQRMFKGKFSKTIKWTWKGRQDLSVWQAQQGEKFSE